MLNTSGGDALVYGESIRNERGLSAIRSIMGVCPQFDILWDNLSAREHLRLYANIKGIPRRKTNKEVEDLLNQVCYLGNRANIVFRQEDGMAFFLGFTWYPIR